jgi:ABC-type microcin C transport system duplicated ATPase subunit YejF
MLDGIELVGLSERELSKVRAEKVGFVFQQPLTALTPHRTVRQHLQRSRDAGWRCQALTRRRWSRCWRRSA